MSHAISTTGLSHEQWLKARQYGIGGSDVAAILGLNPWKTALDVYLEKIDPEPKDLPMNAKMKAGKMLENTIADWFAEESGETIHKDHKIRIHKNFKHLIGNVDRVIISGNGKGTGILEVKSTSNYMIKMFEKNDWPLPPYWYAQLQHYLNVTGYTWGVIAYLVDGYDFRQHQFEADQEFIRNMTEKCNEFWHGHVEPRIPPEPQNEKDVMTLFPESVTDSQVEAEEGVYNIYMELAEAIEKEKMFKLQKEKLQEQLKLVIQDKERLTYHGDTLITWKSSTSNRVDSKKLQKLYPDIYQEVTKQQTIRRFLVK